jgi:hypothetical protein
MEKPSLRWIVDRNPFYLLSACCGLLGCWLLGDISRPDLLDASLKIVALTAYEIAVVALAAWLSKNKATLRDAAILSVVTVTLTADAAFLSTETAMLKPAAAAGFAALSAAQALAIVGVLFVKIPVRMSRRGSWLLALDIVTVHLSPVLLRFGAQSTDSTELVFWPAFVAIGALLAAHAWPEHWNALVPKRPADPLPPAFALALASMAPAAFVTSVVAHTFAAAWVFHADFYPVFLSPPLAGLAFLALRRGWTRSVTVLSIAAVLLAVAPPPETFVLGFARSDWLAVSPLRIVLVWAALVLFGLWRAEQNRSALALSAGFLLLSIFGHTPQAMLDHFAALATYARRVISAGVPASREGWGAALFVLAFVLLGFGAWTSRRRLREG